MGKKFLLVLITLLTFTSMVYATDHTITLIDWEGSCEGIADGNVHDYKITNKIPNNKIIVVSLDWGQTLENSSNISLKNDATGEPTEKHGGWFAGSRMSYFVIKDNDVTYTITVTPDRALPYNVVVSVIDKIGPFIKLDASDRDTDSISYYISNVPELIEPSKYSSLAKDGYYLCRAEVNGNTSIYWEHVNNYKDFIIASLLWNKEPFPLKVSINSGSAFSYTTAGKSMENAMCNVWLPWYKYFKNEHNSAEIKEIVLPPYDSENPGKSAVWLLKDNIPKVSGFVENTFNGLSNITIKNKNGSLYLGDKVLCDTYVLDDDSVFDYVLTNITKMKPAVQESVNSNLRGSGHGAVLETQIPPKKISKDNRFCFLVGGFDMPDIQEGEKVRLTYIDENGKKISPENSHTYGFCNVFKIKFDSLKTSKGVIKGRIINSKKLNPNAAWDKWAGLYVIGYADYGDKHTFKKLIYAGENYIFDENVPQNKPVTYYFVVSGMSSFPLGVEFFAEENSI